MQSHTVKLLTSSLVAAAALAGSAHAATIVWSSATASTSGSFGDILDTGLFDTTGTLISAENVGGAAVTFDTINFTAGTTTFSTGGTFNGFHQAGQELSQTGAYSDANNTGTVSFSGLTIGATYRIQALVFDGRGAVGIPGRTVEFDGVDQGQYANGVFNTTWGPGLLVTGTFTADANTQDFTIEGFNTDPVSSGAQLNALTLYQTSAVPEPSTTALLGLSGLALILRRRK
ncbi:PEP-CTERM sorting domain-containing protein [Rubritalea tangerina]|uniref:PEP-CTERM sorting domain-containing protein n=1 Tax=Rubritalea tangerina TaxID=430798 RepID=A0ABW4Z982_9BACT